MTPRILAAAFAAVWLLAGSAAATSGEATPAKTPTAADQNPGSVIDKDKFYDFLVAVHASANKDGSISPEKLDAALHAAHIDPEDVDVYIHELQHTNPKLFPAPGATPKPPELKTPVDEPKPGIDPFVIPPPEKGPANAGPYGLQNAVNNLAVKDHPDDPKARARRGLNYLWQGQSQLAFTDLSAAVAGGDSDKDVLTGYGQSALHLGDFPLAASVAQQILNDYPGDQAALAIYHSAADKAPIVKLPSALGDLAEHRAPETLPGTGAASNGAAASGFLTAPPPSGMTAEQAVELAKQAAAPGSDAPARSREFTKDAANAMRVRDYPTAYQLSSQAINLNPQNAQALNYRAMSLSQMRRYSDAVQDASAALGLAPGNPAALHTRSWAFSKEKRYKEALADADMASAAEPNNAFLYQDKALALAGLGDRQGALDALRRSAALDPRFTTRLEQATQLPQDSDMTLLFDDGAAAAPVAAAPPAPGSRQRRFLRLAALSAVGGLLIALGILHVVSASWRDRMRMTVRRVLGPSPSVAAVDAPAVDSPSLGSFWTQYEVVKEIGLGGMGVVYEAKDRSLERRVAVKKMRDEIRLDPQDRQRFVNEARTVAQLHHPSIVDIYGIVEDGNDVYLVFEFVEGRTLHDALKSGGPMDLPKARAVLNEMAAAVEHAHGRNIIHRDLKPSNVMLTPEGRVKVMDFGIARMAKEAMTRHSMTNTIAGTPPYMAPEQEQGTVRRESDVYALGVCLYEMTTGFLPFTGSGAAMLLNKLNGKLIPATQRNPALPAGFDAVVAKALEPDADKRYRTPAELVAALDGLSIPA